ncbi:hypothetical protein E2C01_049439 [Portunus trituberculatus]|uniref:Uncharacterized protein n=1 Tax=Portunus trituberculatus TaxID=210409 RepID=A0A5B7G9G0_PORTR|nr:hypothetical protein [Portunus trituberculatus]
MSVGLDGRPPIGSNPTTYQLDTLPFVNCFKVTYMSP